MLTTYADDRSVIDALRAGARGYLTKDAGAKEIEQARTFLESQAALLGRRPKDDPALPSPSYVPAGVEPAEAAAWVNFALAMLNRNEFVYVP